MGALRKKIALSEVRKGTRRACFAEYTAPKQVRGCSKGLRRASTL